MGLGWGLRIFIFSKSPGAEILLLQEPCFENRCNREWGVKRSKSEAGSRGPPLPSPPPNVLMEPGEQ